MQRTKCKCVKDSPLRKTLIVGETYHYQVDKDNVRYPYYMFENENSWLSIFELEMRHTASVSENFFNEHFIDIKKQRTDKLKKINENTL